MAVSKDILCERDLVYAGDERPVNGENGKFYFEVRVPFSSIKIMGLQENQYFSVNGNDYEVDIYYEISEDKVEIGNDYHREARKSETNELMLTKCPMCGKRGKMIRCRGNCSECTIDEDSHRYNDLQAMKPLDATREDGEGNEYSLYDRIPDPKQNVNDSVIYADAMEHLQNTLAEFDENHRQLILSGFQEESQRSVLKNMGIKNSTGRDRADKLFKEVKKKVLGE